MTRKLFRCLYSKRITYWFKVLDHRQTLYWEVLLNMLGISVTLLNRWYYRLSLEMFHGPVVRNMRRSVRKTWRELIILNINCSCQQFVSIIRASLWWHFLLHRCASHSYQGIWSLTKFGYHAKDYYNTNQNIICSLKFGYAGKWWINIASIFIVTFCHLRALLVRKTYFSSHYISSFSNFCKWINCIYSVSSYSIGRDEYCRGG